MNARDLQLLWRKASYWLSPVLLITVATGQTIASHFGTLTAWKGGGFGMFSTQDATDARFLKAYLITEDGDVAVRIPPEFSRDETLICAWPDRIQLSSLANNMASFYWYVGHARRGPLQAQDDRIKFPNLESQSNRPKAVFGLRTASKDVNGDQRIQLNGIRLELWRTRLDPSGMALKAESWMVVTRNAQE